MVNRDNWKQVRLGDVFVEQITGEWGRECLEAESGIKVLRTTNFTNLGHVNYDSVVVRYIDPRKVKVKKLKTGDIILEKSGGSDTQPVGRVVFFDNEKETYLCNNFTQALRSDENIAVNKYVFYFMFYQHQIGVTQLLQNKTTGIRNLQIKGYMCTCIQLPSLEVQKQIAAILDKASELIELRKQQLAKMDRLIKSKFIAMFGDPVINEKGWTQISITNICQEIVDCINKTAPQSDVVTPYKMIRTSNVKTGKISLDSMKYVDKITYEKWIRRSVPQRGDLILTREAPMGEVGIIDFDDRIFLGQRLMQYRCDTSLVNPVYLLHYMQGKGFQNQIERLGKGSTVKHLTVPDCYNLDVVTPPVHLQNHFAAFVDKVERQKALMQASLAKLEINYKALMQQYFG